MVEPVTNWLHCYIKKKQIYFLNNFKAEIVDVVWSTKTNPMDFHFK